jgi:hypothetical protein
VWIGSYTATLGSWQIGVRVDDVDAHDFLVAELGDVLQPSDSPPPGYSVVTTDVGSNDVGRELPSLRFGHASVFRSRSPLRLAQALVNHLHSHPDPSPETLRLRTAAVVRDGAAVLVPSAVIWTAGNERQLHRLGLSPFDSPIVDVDATGCVRLAFWGQGEVVRSEPMEIAAWLIPEHLLGAMNPQARSSLVAVATNLIDPASRLDPQAALNRVAELLSVIEPFGAEWSLADIAESPEARLLTG